jgi:hypothetical protein
VIQIYNILNIVDLLEYAEEVMVEANRDIIVDFLFCLHPDFLDIIHLPDNVKEVAIERLEEFKMTSRTYSLNTDKAFFMKNGIDSTITRLQDSMGQENPTMIRDFLAYTKTLDVERKQSLAESMPELVFLLEEAGYDIEAGPTLETYKVPQREVQSVQHP